jgi:hypothetical protein
VIVFGGHEDIAVEPGDFLLPALGDWILRGAQAFDATSSKNGIGKSRKSTISASISSRPAAISWIHCGLVAEAGSAGGADNDRDLELLMAALSGVTNSTEAK